MLVCDFLKGLALMPRSGSWRSFQVVVSAELKGPRRVGTARRKPAGCGTHHEPNQQTYEQNRRNELSLHTYRAHTETLDTCPKATHESSYVRNKGLLQPHNVKMSAMRRFKNFPCLRGRVEVEYCKTLPRLVGHERRRAEHNGQGPAVINKKN